MAAPAGEDPDARDRSTVPRLHGTVQPRQGGEEPLAAPRLQVLHLQHRATDVPRQGDGVRADEDSCSGRAVELRRRAGTGPRRGAEAVHRTSHEEWASCQGAREGLHGPPLAI